MERDTTQPVGLFELLEPRVLLSAAADNDLAASDASAGAALRRAKRKAPIGEMKARFGGVFEGADGDTTILRIVIKRSGPKALLKPASVEYQTIAAPTAIPAAAADFAATTAAVNFAAQAKRAFAEVLVFGNDQPQGNRHVAIQLFNPVGGTIKAGADIGIGGIIDDDTNPPPEPPPEPVRPKISIANASTSEGNSGSKDLNFTVTLDQATTVPVTVNFATANGSATTADNDYQAASGTLTFNPGQTSRTVTVKIVGDTKFESNETFVVNLTSPTNADIVKAQATGTITNDDAQGTPDLTIIDSGVLVDFDAQVYNVSLSIKNNGTAASPATKVRFELRDVQQEPSTRVLVEINVPAIAAGQSLVLSNLIVDPKPAISISDFPALWAVLTLSDANNANNADFVGFVPTGENLTDPQF